MKSRRSGNGKPAPLPARRGFLFAAAALAVVPGPARAADYPTRPVHLLVGQAPGGQTDTIARAIAFRLSEHWRVAVVVDNQAGASGMIAARTVAQATADGYTLLAGSNASLVLGPVTTNDDGYDTLRDFAPIGRIARITYALVVRPGIAVSSVREFVALARANPGAITIATAGATSSVATIAGLFARAAGIELLQVPYKGGAPGIQALLAGQVDATICDASAVATHVAAGTLRMLAMVGAQRSALAPDVPTMREAGYVGIGDDPWYGLAAPARTPPAVIAEVSAVVRGIARDPEMRTRFRALGYEMFDESPAEFARALALEIAQARTALGGERAGGGR